MGPACYTKICPPRAKALARAGDIPYRPRGCGDMNINLSLFNLFILCDYCANDCPNIYLNELSRSKIVSRKISDSLGKT